MRLRLRLRLRVRARVRVGVRVRVRVRVRGGVRAEEHARGSVDEAEGDDGADGDAAERGRRRAEEDDEARLVRGGEG